MVIKYCKEPFIRGGLQIPLDIVQEYTYLVTRIPSTGNFNVPLDSYNTFFLNIAFIEINFILFFTIV